MGALAMAAPSYGGHESSSAAAANAIGQLQLQLSHYSLAALQAFCFPKCDF